MLRPLLLLALLASLSTIVASPPAAGADPGDYTVRLTTTEGAHWDTYVRGPFLASPGRVASGRGVFATGDYRSWRVRVVGSGSRITGGRMGIAIATPNAPMQARIVVGTGSTPTVVYDSAGTGNAERAFSGLYDWAQFDLRSTGSITTTSPGQDTVDLRYVELTLHDSVPPVLAAVAVPDPGRWHGAGDCIPYTVRVGDQGGGVLRAEVRRVGDGALVHAQAAPQAASTRPGPEELVVADCIHSSERGNGDTSFVVTAWDVGGTARAIRFSVRADHRPPDIAGGPVEGARITTPRPTIAFTTTDDGSGLAAVHASVDGAPVPLDVTAGTATLHVGELARGAHVIAVTAADAAGNTTSIQRRVTVADDAPPVLTVASPGARGDATATLTVRASDAFSGVDDASWTARLDGAAIAFRADSTQLAAQLGGLPEGAHRFDVTVRDRAGNVASIAHAYFVVPPAQPSAADVAGTAAAAAANAVVQATAPGRSGVSLVDGPRAIVTHGRRVSVAVQVARAGSPVVSQLVEVRRGATVLGSGVTDHDGVARVRFLATRPAPHTAVAVGLAFEALDLRIRVAPRLRLATRTSKVRVGQRVAVSGQIIPMLRGRRVALEAKVDGVWFPIRRAASTDRAGRFRSTVTPTSRGPVAIRVRLLASGAWAPAVSNAIVLRAW